jgi:CBS domain-containing protein
MIVQDVMTKNAKCCLPSEALSRAAQIMWENDCGCVPVVDERNRVIGMITDRDVCMAAYTQDRPPSAIKVASAMARDVHGCRPEDSLEVAEEIMRRQQVRRLPVLGHDRQLLGILSLNDLARAVANKPRDRSPGLNAAAIEATLAAVCQPRRGLDGPGPMPSL